LLAAGAQGVFIVLEDDDCLHVHPSAEAAALAIEGLDAEDTIRAAFDETGVPHRIEWLVPNKSGSFLGLDTWAENGRYRLVPAGPPDLAAFAELLRSPRPVFPPEAAAALAELGRGAGEP
jgi:hypothetical protein